MEKLRNIEIKTATALSVAGLALTACTIDSYLTDVTNVHCDGKRTIQDLREDGLSTFIIHGKDNAVAKVVVKKKDSLVAIATASVGDPKQLEFGRYEKIDFGYEFDMIAAGGAWLINASEDDVYIHGSCENILMDNISTRH